MPGFPTSSPIEKARRNRRRRISQRDIFPSAIKPRLLGNIIQRLSVTQSTVTGLNDGDQVLNQILVTNIDNKRLLVTTERATYITSVSNANLLPAGSSVDESQWQVIGPFDAIIKGDGAAIDGNDFANQLYIRNISAGASQTIIFRGIARYVINEGGTA